MIRAAAVLLPCALNFLAFGQAGSGSHASTLHQSVVWEPQLLYKFNDAVPRATVRHEMIGSLRISDLKVQLEEDSRLDDLQRRFGGEVGHEGDAGDSLLWLCLHAADAGGPWVLWLESGEIDGPYVGRFQWSRVPRTARFDRRCSTLQDSTTIQLPDGLRLEVSEGNVLRTLGRPTVREKEVLVYEHEHDEMIRGESFNSSNTVVIRFQGGKLWAIDVQKTTTN